MCVSVCTHYAFRDIEQSTRIRTQARPTSRRSRPATKPPHPTHTPAAAASPLTHSPQHTIPRVAAAHYTAPQHTPLRPPRASQTQLVGKYGCVAAVACCGAAEAFGGRGDDAARATRDAAWLCVCVSCYCLFVFLCVLVFMCVSVAYDSVCLCV